VAQLFSLGHIEFLDFAEPVFVAVGSVGSRNLRYESCRWFGWFRLAPVAGGEQMRSRRFSECLILLSFFSYDDDVA